MFAKVFGSLWNGSLHGQLYPQIVFVYLLANANGDGIVDVHPAVIASSVGAGLAEVEAALLVLEGPDAQSRTPDHEGRRIERMDAHRAWGWSIVNYAKYRALRNEDERRADARDRMRLKRQAAAKAGELFADVRHGSPPFSQGEVEVEVKNQKTMSATADAARDWLEFFETNIWPHRPRKGAPGPHASESHKDAASRWAKIRPQTAENANRIADALEGDVAAMRAEGREAKTCPHLSTWLNDAPWLNPEQEAS